MPTVWTQPRTWTPYEPVTRNLLNTYVRNQFLGVSFLSTRFVTSDTTLAAVTLNLPTSTEALSCEIVVMGRSEGAGGGLRMRANASSANYFWTAHFSSAGASTGSAAANDTSWNVGNVGITGADNVAMTKITLPGHNSTHANKHFMSHVARFDSTAVSSAFAVQLCGMWNDTAAIASVIFTIGAGANFSAGTEFSVYGLP